MVLDLIGILHSVSGWFPGGSRFNRYTSGSWCFRVVADLIGILYYIVFQSGFRVVPDLIGILHNVSGWFQI